MNIVLTGNNAVAPDQWWIPDFYSGLSGCYQSVNICSDELREQYPQRKILVIDTLCTSMGEGLLILKAAWKQAGYSIDQTMGL